MTVLLLEAGGRPSTIHTVPSYAIYADRPQDRWGFTVNAYPGSCLSGPGQQCIYPLAKLLGGSSSFNYLIWARGNRNDYDTWQDMGNYGWAYDQLWPLFQRIENATQVENRDLFNRGIEGPLSVSHAKSRTMIVDNFIDALGSRGVPYIDYNGASQIGVDYTQAVVKEGRRHSAVSAYLEPVIGRRNLHVMINSLVSKVIIDRLTKTAQGVQFNHQGMSYQVLSKKEVILSAGPVMSPQLLMLSGIGPREDLTTFDIPVLSDLPVGRKYLDHVTSGNYLFLINTTGQNINLEAIQKQDAEEFVRSGTGRLTIPAVIEAIAFLNLGLRNLSTDQPDIELLFSPGKNEAGYDDFSVMRLDIYNALFKPIEDPSIEVFSLSIVDLYPQSRGSIRLRGGSINNPPIIAYPFFDRRIDMESHLRTIKKIIRITETPAMQRIGARLYNVPIPDCAHLDFGSDRYWECHVRHFSRMVCHAAATCKMGPKDDSEAVVDPELRVYGINRLRVADSSIAPTQVAGHTQAVSYVVGEKMAMLLKQEWNI